MATHRRHGRHTGTPTDRRPDPRPDHPPDLRADLPPDVPARPPSSDARPEPRPDRRPDAATGARPHTSTPAAPRAAEPPDAQGTARTPTEPPEPHAAALAEALLAAGRGYPVIPLTRNKLPAIRSPHRGRPESPPCRGQCGRLGHGVHDASTDPLTIRRMFATAPWATGYGIACGRPPHHLIGIDLDTKNGADGLTALRFLAEQHDFPIPPTVTVLTPSGGRHLWFTGPPSPPVPNSAGRLAPGIDVRGTAGYLVGPGSVTTGGRYAHAPHTPRHPAPLPGALLDLLLAPPPSAHREPQPDVAPQHAAALIRFVRTAPDGQRNARLFWAACRAHEAGLGQELAARLTQAARDTGLSAHEAHATIASAARATPHSH
ncbi:bifunctional DNA primase/polymerase [Streptomyces sp. C184]|uniref:bifunctional DNA primase/polymerase n=1 Tax=Streptomyces sp. C184 TaxID=3237121 RepID=UPI0034C64BAF